MEHCLALWNHYESIAETLCKHYGALWNVMEALRGIVECYGMLRSIAECYGKHYGTVTENMDFAHL